MPQFDTTFFASQIFWTVVSFVVLFAVLKRWFLPAITKILDQRAEYINQEITGANIIRMEAENIKAECEKQLAEMEQQTSKMLLKAEKEMISKREQSLSELNDEIQHKKRQFLADEAVLRERTIREVSKQSAELVIAATEQLIQQKMEEADAQQLLEHIVDELDLNHKHAGSGVKR